MNQKLLFSIVLHLVSFSVSGQNWHRQSLLNLATIDFPAKPQFRDTLGQKVYHYVGDTAYFVAQVLKNKGEDEGLVSEKEFDEYYEGMIEGILEVEKGKLITQNKILIDGLNGIEIEYTITAKKNTPNLKFKRFILLNSRVFSMDYWTLSEFRNVTDSDRRKFFDSFRFLEKSSLSNQHKTNTNSRSSSSAYLSGRIFGYLMLALIIIGLIYFAVKKR